MVKLTQGETLTISGESGEAVSLSFIYGGPSKGTQALTIDSGKYNAKIATDAMNPGSFKGQVWAVYADSSKKIICTVLFSISAPLRDGTDERSTARRSYEAICAMLEGRATDGVKRYEIAGRELERYSVAELLSMKADFARTVKKEEGRKPSRIIFFG